MGKNHRHKKRLKAETSKTQLKSATKFLPKGQNVTNTEFKLKPIVLISQLAFRTSGDGQQIVDLKDILSRLKHYNENMKIKACEDLEFLIKNKKEALLGGNISLVIQNLAEFIQVRMPKARKAGLSVINTILCNFPIPQIDPYFHYFSVNLRCAMTHIDRNVQEDSILFLDSFLTNVPSLAAKHSSQILPDFLTLISKLRNDAEFKRTVTVNLKSKFTSVGWRIVVFSRLYVFLEAVVSDKISNEMEIDVDQNVVTNHAENFVGKALLKSWDVLFSPKINVSEVPTHGFGVENSTKKQFSLLVPLLLETWLEGAPVKPPSKEVTYMTEETSMLLNCVIKVFHLLWSYFQSVEKNIMGSTMPADGEKLIKHLVLNLPYCLINRPKQQEKPNKFLSMFITTDVKCMQENLLICYLYFILHNQNPSKTKQREIENIVTVINGCLLRDYANTSIDITYLMMILKHLLVDKSKLWSRNGVPVYHILVNTITMYQNGNLKWATKSVLLKLLASVNYEPLIVNQCYESWLESLPKLLIEKSISEDVIDSMFDMSRKNKTAFNKGYFNDLPLILENLSNLKVTGSVDPERAKQKIIDMLYYVPLHNHFQVLFRTVLKESPYLDRIEYVFELRKEFHRG
ncbi:hypothetical protein HHI36_021788 [Cryptolaemus montrouzieri]|uniref:Pre-rRNA-processing protein Ipi1 N-terminal domain-containing protein n=1 Tax=Cryptolaemus montrouzieri TaxID=559131 RepID=A0ABD2MY47_9CUCU